MLPKDFTASIEDEFWSSFKGNMILTDLLKHFVLNFPYEEQNYKKLFATEIVGRKLIQKQLDSKKLYDLVDQEISRLDINKIKNSISISKTKMEELDKVTIYDVDRFDGFAFEDFVKKLLERNGFTDVEVTKKSGDQGGDIIASKDEQKFIIQAKRYSIDRKVSNDAVQEVKSAIAYYECDLGAVITNSFFTPSAKELASVNNIILWDRIEVSKFLEFL